MILRDAPTKTLEDIGNEWSRKTSRWSGGLYNVAVNLEAGEPTIKFGAHEIPATDRGIEALAGALQVPTAFIGRVEPDEQQWILTKRIERADESKNVAFSFTSSGVEEITKADLVRLEPYQFVDTASNFFPADSLVVEARLDHTELFLDVIVPEDYKQVGGDPAVGDITRGGLRFFQNRKQNLAPTVSQYLYRLICTNGMEVEDKASGIDARGADETDLLFRYQAAARLAYERLEETIGHFYDLKNQKIGDDRTGVLRRTAQEAGFADRVIGQLEDLLPSYVDDGTDQVSMFTLANLITNNANSFDSRHNTQRRAMEVAAGNIVNDHAQRCTTCHSRLN